MSFDIAILKRNDNPYETKSRNESSSFTDEVIDAFKKALNNKSINYSEFKKFYSELSDDAVVKLKEYVDRMDGYFFG